MGSTLKTVTGAYRNKKKKFNATVQQGKPRLELPDIIFWGDSWLAVRRSESLFCLVWTGLCLAGGFSLLYPTGTVQQRHLYKPFLRIKPVVTFFFSTEFGSMSTPKQGAPADHTEQLLPPQIAVSVIIQQTLGLKPRWSCWYSLYFYKKCSSLKF